MLYALLVHVSCPWLKKVCNGFKTAMNQWFDTQSTDNISDFQIKVLISLRSICLSIFDILLPTAYWLMFPFTQNASVYMSFSIFIDLVHDNVRNNELPRPPTTDNMIVRSSIHDLKFHFFFYRLFFSRFDRVFF